MTDNTPIPDLTVETVRIVAHTMGPVAPGAQLSQNHWSIYLVVGESASVRLNMIPSTKEGDDKGIFHVTRHLYTLTNSAVRYFDFGVANKMIVRQVLDLIASKKRHQYIMTPTGVGCRHWVLTVVKDLADAGYLADANAAETLAQPIQYNYSRNQVPIPLTMREGMFY